jgi:hypothetical protein
MNTTTATQTPALVAYSTWRLARAHADINYLTTVQELADKHSGGHITHKQETTGIHAAWLQKLADEQAADDEYMAGGGLA